MATQSPYSLVENFLQNLRIPFSPPLWVVDETHRRVVLLLNHVLMQEPSAQERLTAQRGRVVLLQWRTLTFKVIVTPAGLLDVAAADLQADLTLTLIEESPLAMVQGVMQDYKPSVRMDGDAELAAELAWLMNHVQWDIEEDLSRILGDPMAHALADVGRNVLAGLRQLMGVKHTASDSAGSMP